VDFGAHAARKISERGGGALWWCGQARISRGAQTATTLATVWANTDPYGTKAIAAGRSAVFYSSATLYLILGVALVSFLLTRLPYAPGWLARPERAILHWVFWNRGPLRTKWVCLGQ